MKVATGLVRDAQGYLLTKKIEKITYMVCFLVHKRSEIKV